MKADQVVACARGMRLAQRQAPAEGAPATLRVGADEEVCPPARPPIEAQLPDGTVWRRHWNDPERLVVEFVGVAFVEVQEQRGSVVFDRPISDQMEQHLLLDHILPLVLARAGAIVLHGAVISREDAAAVLVGPTGAGKSTLTAFAAHRGWIVGGDDGAVLSPSPRLQVEPTYATVRLTRASSDLLGLSPDATSAVLGKTRMRSDIAVYSQSPLPLRLIAFLEPVGAGEPAALREVRGVAGHALLIGSTFHADFSGTSLPLVVQGLGAIVEAVTVARLSVPRGLAGLAAAEALLRDAVCPADVPAAGVSS